MTSKQEWLDYHVSVFTDYYNSLPVKTESMDDVAQGMWDMLYTCRSSEPNPFCLVNYSAGVYLGLHHSLDADAIAVLPDLSNLQFVTPYTDLWEVLTRMDNPDAHADGADEYLQKFADSIREDREDDCLPTAEQLFPALCEYMKVACPEYTVVLRAWNSQTNLTDEQFWSFWAETHCATFESYWDS